MIDLKIDPELEDPWRRVAEFHMAVFVGVASSAIRHVRLNVSRQNTGDTEEEQCVCELDCEFYYGIKSHHRVVDIEKNRALTNIFSQARRQLRRNANQYRSKVITSSTH
ncbi:MAG: hypothetical protein ACI9YO_002108 [Gammaproteobacteria bacterium]|jgi:hypothetical protein